VTEQNARAQAAGATHGSCPGHHQMMGPVQPSTRASDAPNSPSSLCEADHLIRKQRQLARELTRPRPIGRSVIRRSPSPKAICPNVRQANAATTQLSLAARWPGSPRYSFNNLRPTRRYGHPLLVTPAVTEAKVAPVDRLTAKNWKPFETHFPVGAEPLLPPDANNVPVADPTRMST
jgi:hypothetical protein